MGHYAGEIDGSPGPNHDTRQVPYPSPENVVAHILADQPLIPTARARLRLAHKITTALRAAGWRILRS
jgi:hypothetical protein